MFQNLFEAFSALGTSNYSSMEPSGNYLQGLNSKA